MSLSALQQMVATYGPKAVLERTPADLRPYLPYIWTLWARPEQLPPPMPWTKWLVLAGRGFGKTRCGAEWVLSYMRSHPGCRVALIGRTTSDTLGVMVNGESGLLARAHASDDLQHIPSKRLLVMANGSQAETYSADEPNQLRGPQHHAAWADEVAAWYGRDAWDQLMMGLRLEWRGQQPQVVVTTTPRPVPVVRELLADPACVTTRGSTYDNRANLAASFFADIIKRYEGTRLGDQELRGIVLDDVPGALWRREWLRLVSGDAGRVRVVVGVDPSTTSGEDSDETGIVVAALLTDGRYLVLDDASMRGTPEAWAAQVVKTARKWEADSVVVETNQGGELVKSLLLRHDASLPVRGVHAKHGKRLRAEPVAMLYEQGRVMHRAPMQALEEQMTSFDFEGTSGTSPDRVDALVYALSDLAQSDIRIPTQTDTRDEGARMEAALIAQMQAELEEATRWQ